MGRLRGKTAIITGAGAGNGRATALCFAKEGCNVALSDIAVDAVHETAAMAREHGVQATSCRADVTVRADVEAMVAGTIATFGTVDVLVNNAGVFFNASVAEMTDEQWHRMIDINLTSVFLVSQAVIRHWLERERAGAIVNLSSISASIAFTNSAHYCAAKAGVSAMTRCIALEYGPVGIRCNALAPGVIETNMTKPALSDPATVADWTRRIPLRHFGQPRDVADAALFLASDEARYITGEVLTVDGGWVLE
jgi:NAD(P)-dependent dehydrogenase (short-subunit alcohol dehydrogenase family)